MQDIILSWLRRFLPIGTIIVLMLSAVTLSRVSPLSAVFLPIMGLHFWSIPQPIAIPVSVVFVLALLQDVIFATSLGLHPTTWLLFYAASLASAFAVQGNRILSLTMHYALLSLLVPITLNALTLLKARGLAGGADAFIGWAGACLIYPLVALLLKWLEQKVN